MRLASGVPRPFSAVGLDTSVVLRLLLGEPSAQAESAMRFLTQRTAAGAPPAQISDLVISEVFFALQHHYAVPRAQALAALEKLLSDPHLSVAPAASSVLKSSGNGSRQPGFADRLIHEQYRLDGAAFVSFDRLAARLTGTILLGAAATP
jgi:predicted nucleic-acid-binding protein